MPPRVVPPRRWVISGYHEFIIGAGPGLDQAKGRRAREGRWTGADGDDGRRSSCRRSSSQDWPGAAGAGGTSDDTGTPSRGSRRPFRRAGTPWPTRDLSDLLARRPDWDRAAYLLGVCKKARGRPQEADAAWAGIGPDSSLGGRAVADRMDLLIEQGRLADAEDLIEREAAARGPEGIGAPDVADPDLGAGRPGGGSRAADRVGDGGAWTRRAKGRRSRPSTWRGCTWSCAGMSRRRPSRSGPISTRSAGWPRTTTGSGWDGRTWRSGSARSTRRRGGSTPASGAGPTIHRSGGRGWTGR